MDDSAIIDLYFKRNEKAIEATSEKYGRYLGKIAFNILADIQDSDDCVNDTYLKTWNVIPPELPTRLGAFLAKITRNLALDKYRSRKTDKRRASEYALSLEELGECIFKESEEAIDDKIIADCINLHLEKSKELDRRIFVLRYFYSESVASIAKKVGVKESRVKVILFRSREKLKEILVKEGVFG